MKVQSPMPVVLKIDPQRKVVHSAFYGRITDAELLTHHKRIAADPDFNSQFADIVDFSDVTDPAITESAIATLAANPSLFSSSAVHIVIAPASVVFRLGGRFKELARSSRPNFHVVKTRAGGIPASARWKETKIKPALEFPRLAMT